MNDFMLAIRASQFYVYMVSCVLMPSWRVYFIRLDGLSWDLAIIVIVFINGGCWVLQQGLVSCNVVN